MRELFLDTHAHTKDLEPRTCTFLVAMRGGDMGERTFSNFDWLTELLLFFFIHERGYRPDEQRDFEVMRGGIPRFRADDRISSLYVYIHESLRIIYGFSGFSDVRDELCNDFIFQNFPGGKIRATYFHYYIASFFTLYSLARTRIL